MTIENDIVLIYIEDTPLGFARVESISPDVKKDWFIIELLLLQVPLQNLSWILRDTYINGEEFTMDGKRIRLEKIVSPRKKIYNESEKNANLKKKGNKAKVISLSDLKKT